MVKLTDWLNRSKITLIIYMLISAAILILGFYYYKQQKHELQDKIEDELKSITELKANQLTQWYTERLSEVIYFSNENMLIESTRRVILGDTKKKISLKKILVHMLSNKRYENIFIVSTSGSLAFSLDSTFNTLDSIDINLSKQAIKGNDILFSDIYLDKILNTPQLDFAAPIKDKKGIIIASLIFRINPKDFLYPFIQSWPIQSKTAETVIVRKDGDSVIFINDVRHKNESALKIKFPLTRNDVPAVRAALGSYGIFEGYDYRHVEVLTYSMPIPKTSWIMISKVDTDEINRPIHNQARNFGLILFLFIVLLISLLISIRSADKNRHYKKLFDLETERKILLSHFEYLIKYANDIIILANEFGQIVEANESALVAYQLTNDEIKKKKISTLGKFNINFEKHNKIQFEVSNKPYESVHKRKNGEEFPVEISEKVIEIDSAHYYQAIIRDISERKKSEIELNENEVQYRNLANSGRALLWKSGTDKLCTYFNEPWLKFTGRTLEQELGNGWAEGIHPEDFNDCLQTHVTSFDDRKPFEMEYRLRHASGEYRWIKDMGTPNYNSKGEFIGYIGHCFDITNQKTIEDTLIKSEATHRLLFDNNPIPMWVYELETLKFLKVNDAAINKYGFSNDEFLSMTLKDIRPPEDVQLLLANVNTDKAKIQNSGAWRHRLKNGKIILVDIHSHEIIFDDKKARIVATYDITERVKIEEEIQHLNERISTATEAAQIGIWDWDIVNNILVWDDRMYSLYGLSKDEFKGAYDAWLKGIHPDDRSNSDEESRLALSGEKEYDSEYRVIWPDNSIHYIKAKGNVFRDEDGKPIRMLGVNFDITEQKKAESIVKDSEEKLSNLISAMQVGVLLQDSHSKILMSNIKALELLGITEEQLLGKTSFDPDWNVIHEDGSPFPGSTHPVPKAIATGQPVLNIVMGVYRPTKGNRVWLLVDAVPQLNSNGNVQQVVCTFIDISQRKQAEKDLHESEELYQRLFENMLNGFAYCKMYYENDIPTDFRYLSVNKSFEKLTGLKNVSGKLVSDVVPGIRKADPKLFEFYNRVALTGIPESFELYVETLNDWYSVTAYSSQKEYFVAIFDVITERKLSEEVLRKNEERYRTTLDNMIEGCQIIGLDWKYIYINKAAEKQNRRPNNELIGQKYAEMWPGVESTLVFGSMRKVMEERVDLHFENEFTFPDGYTGWYDLSIQHVPEGIFILSVDITERKQAEDKLNQLNSELEQRILERTKELSDLYNNAPCGYHSLDKDGLFIHINDTELKLLGYKREEVVGKINVSEIMTQKSQEKFKTLYPLFKKQEFLMDIELEFIKKDGSILPILLSATAVYDTNGDYLMSRSTLIDNTYLKRAKDEILESKTILELANKELEAFSYSVSHDLRAPLRAIHGFIQMLEEDYNDKLDAEGIRLITVVKDNTKRMGQLIDNLLAFSRITRAEIKKTNFEPASIIESIFSEQVSPESREKIKLTIRKLPNITGDANLFRQVWANLISNAVKYTSKINNPEIEIGCTERKDENEFYIKDNGAGFDMLYIDKLFGVFQRLHNTKDFEGTGVGLAIIQRIIVRHGGKIWAKGEVDKGATFFFTIPK